MTTYAAFRRPVPAPPWRASEPGDRTACALAAGMVERILPALAGRRTLDQTGARVSAPVAGLINAARRSNPLGGPNYRVRSVHACMTSSCKVEACAVVSAASRMRALVLRMEQKDTVWSCTMLAII